MTIRKASSQPGFRNAHRGPYRRVMDAIVNSPVSPASQATPASQRPATQRPASQRLGERLVEVRDLQLTVPSAAGPVNILRGIDLDIATGEAIGVVGPSGSGKTSLLMVLAGLEQATAGSVR